MKITRIYLKNLNSLRGEFTLNLEDEPFANTGIFAITGPTGAGKSTILDAITLALYGRAARYDAKPNPENMMSRGTGECQADVEFKVAKGRFRASWQLKRARGKPDGKVQPVQRYVYEKQGTHDVPIAQKVSEVDKLIAELTGLDVDRFFRSVLLAQGDFVKFLKATSDERASLLESLTGTGIYSELSIRAHEEAKRKEDAFKLKQKELENIKRLSEEERTAFSLQIDELTTGIKKNELQLALVATRIEQGKELLKNLEQLTSLKHHLETIHRENLSWQPEFNRLNAFRKGSIFFPALKHLDELLNNSCEKQVQRDRAEHALVNAKCDLRAGIDASMDMISKQTTDVEKALSELSAAQDKKKRERDFVNSWLETHQCDHALDMELSTLIEKLTSLSHHWGTVAGLQAKEEALAKKMDESLKLIADSQTDKEKALWKTGELLLAVETTEKNLQAFLQGQSIQEIQQNINLLHDAANIIEKKQGYLKALKEKNKELADLRDNILQLTAETLRGKQITAEEESLLHIEEDNIRRMKEQRAESLLIASLHDHREKLEHGKPCPLCGAQDHPFITTSEISPPKISDLDKELKRLETLCAQRRNKCQELLLAYTRSQETLKNKSAELEKATLQADSIKELLRNFEPKQVWKQPEEDEVEKEALAIHEQLSKYRFIWDAANDAQKKKEELQKMQLHAQHDLALIQNKIAMVESAIEAAHKDIHHVAAERQNAKTAVSLLEASLFKHLQPYGLSVPLPGEEKNIRDTLEIRKRAYQDHIKRASILAGELSTLSNSSCELEHRRKNLEVEMDKIKKFALRHEMNLIHPPPHTQIEFSALWHSIEEAHEGLTRLEGALIKTQNTLDGHKEEFAKAQHLYSDAKINLSAELQNTEFKTIDILRTAQLPQQDVVRLLKKEEEIKEDTAKLQGQLSHLEKEISNLMQKDAPQGDRLLELQNNHDEIKKLTNNLHQDLGATMSILHQDGSNHQLYATLWKELEVDRAQLFIWRKLSDLIGSHDGKTFRKFAQGLSLDLLIRHANTHFSLLSNRYRLKRTAGEQLDLEIQDLHQANALRPTASLSGGESFLTSLALALGLSDLAGKNVRIDSLFIDEGFGTLDPETLEVAVQALENLRSNNKIIGVISHIELLKERIPTQIIIEKGAAGISKMSISF